MLRLTTAVVGLIGFLCTVTSVHAGYKVPLSHAGKSTYVGKSIDPGVASLIGECAAGVQKVFRDYYGSWVLKQTRYWHQGAKVFGNNNIEPGTAIASFRGGCYANDHAAIYIRQDGGAIYVYDQFNNPPKVWGVRRLWNTYGTSSNNPEDFYVIEPRTAECSGRK